MSFKVGDKVYHGTNLTKVVYISEKHGEVAVLCDQGGIYVTKITDLKPTPTLKEGLEEIESVKSVVYMEKEGIVVNTKGGYFAFKVKNMTEDEILNKCIDIIKAF